MPYSDMPLEQLQAYKPARSEAADFDTFWESTLQEARSFSAGCDIYACKRQAQVG